MNAPKINPDEVVKIVEDPLEFPSLRQEIPRAKSREFFRIPRGNFDVFSRVGSIKETTGFSPGDSLKYE
jgi:hypothetical protein